MKIRKITYRSDNFLPDEISNAIKEMRLKMANKNYHYECKKVFEEFMEYLTKWFMMHTEIGEKK